MSWIAGNGAGTKWRVWQDGLPQWTRVKDEATRFARRIDAEAVHAEDDDAWTVIELEELVTGKTPSEEPVAWLGSENEKLCDDAAMHQWERSLKRPDLAEKDRVRGALEVFKRQAIALQMLASPAVAPVAVSVKGREAPICPLMRDNGEAEWKQIIALFFRNGINEVPIRLRDELSNMLAWARYGESLTALSAQDTETK